MTFKADIAERALTVYAKGAFDQLNPAVVLERQALEATSTARVDATLRIAEPVGADHARVDPPMGRVTLDAVADRRRADRRRRRRRPVRRPKSRDITQLHVKGPDVTLDASGRLALGPARRHRTSSITSTPPTSPSSASSPARKGSTGRCVLDGTITGNAASLEDDRHAERHQLAYGDNKALDLNSKYTVTVAGPGFRQRAA